MALDVVDLRGFYTSLLGAIASRFINQAIRGCWTDPVHGLSCLGIGYATPYLNSWREAAERTLAFMPAVQGGVNWPGSGPSACTLVEPTMLPLPDASIDRALIVHALEVADDPGELLSEVWRVLAPGGRLIVVVPNRRGLWARFDTTPFGEGRPFSRSQLNKLMRESLFCPENSLEALFVPPFAWRPLLGAARAWERFGRYVPLFGGGIHIIDATKQLYRPIVARAPRRSSARFRIPLAPIALPTPSGQSFKTAPLVPSSKEKDSTG